METRIDRSSDRESRPKKEVPLPLDQRETKILPSAEEDASYRWRTLMMEMADKVKEYTKELQTVEAGTSEKFNAFMDDSVAKKNLVSRLQENLSGTMNAVRMIRDHVAEQFPQTRTEEKMEQFYARAQEILGDRPLVGSVDATWDKKLEKLEVPFDKQGPVVPEEVRLITKPKRDFAAEQRAMEGNAANNDKAA